MMAETYMLQAIQKGLATIRSSPDLLSDILNALSPSELAEAQSWFSNPATSIFVAPGFPADQNKLPFIGVTVANQEPIKEQTGIGLAYYNYTDEQTGDQSNVRGMRFRGVLKSTIYTPNANIVVWLSSVVNWALLSQLDTMVSQGLDDISISTGDYEPSPGFLPVFTFARGVFLSANYDLLVVTPIVPVTSIAATGTFNE